MRILCLILGIFGSSLLAKSFTKVAYIGDSGSEESFVKALHLIKKQKADLVVHLGDLAYRETDPTAPRDFDSKINSVLGADYPYLYMLGNHDVAHWFLLDSGYLHLLKQRLSRLKEVKCIPKRTSFDHGMYSVCTFKNIEIILSSVGSLGLGHEKYVERTLKSMTKPWKVCSWHKNQRDMQTGTKIDETGWGVYQRCQEAGAMVVTGHEHAYGRTKTLTKVGIKNKDTQHGYIGTHENVYTVPGKTFVIVSGMGGRSLRPFDCRHHGNPWWSSIHTSDFSMKLGKVTVPKDCSVPNIGKDKEGIAGVLFVNYPLDSSQHKATAQFLTTTGETLDQFSIFNKE